MMITPARWYSGGMGLNEFRNEMLNDRRIKELVDFKNSKDVFPGVDIAGGVCYFHWERDYNGMCKVSSSSEIETTELERPLNEFDIFIRESESIQIVRKITKLFNKFLNSRVSAIKPFGLPSNYSPKENGVPCWFVQRIGLKFANKTDYTDNSIILINGNC
jgi:site-specific DNA-methyltransferase (adenine-specific)